MTASPWSHWVRMLSRHISALLAGVAAVLVVISLLLYWRSAAVARQPRATGLSLHSTLTAAYGAPDRRIATPLGVRPASLQIIADTMRDLEPAADVAGRMATLTTRLQTPVPSITPNQQTAVAALAATLTPTGTDARPGVSTPTATPTGTGARPGVSTPTATPTFTATPTPTGTHTATPDTPTPTGTRTVTPATPTFTATSTPTGTRTATPDTPTPTSTRTATAVPPSPTATETPTATAPACSAGPLTVAGNTLSLNLVNGPAGPATLTRLTVEWVRSPNSQKLRTLALAGAPLMASLDNDPPTLLPDEQAWAGAEADRAFGPNATRTLTMGFQDPLGAGPYRVVAEFSTGCAITASN